MTIQEAIEQLNSLIRDRQSFIDNDEHDSIYISDIEALNIAQEALEKQIPRKLSYEGDGYDDNGGLIYDTAYCPNCQKEFEVYYDEHANFCPNCGQALNWSDEDENNT